MSSFPFLFTVGPTPKPSKGALGAGAIAGIVVGVLVGFIVILVVIAYRVRNSRQRTSKANANQVTRLIVLV